jgi:hypothetical protein
MLKYCLKSNNNSVKKQIYPIKNKLIQKITMLKKGFTFNLLLYNSLIFNILKTILHLIGLEIPINW